MCVCEPEHSATLANIKDFHFCLLFTSLCPSLFPSKPALLCAGAICSSLSLSRSLLLCCRTFFCIVINNKTICLFSALHLLFTPHSACPLSDSFSLFYCLYLCCYYLKGSSSVTASVQRFVCPVKLLPVQHQRGELALRDGRSDVCLAFTFCGQPNRVINIYLSSLAVSIL